MVFGFIIGIAIAYLLTFFQLDQTLISGVKNLINIDIGRNGYFLLLGIVGGVSRVMFSGFLTGLIVAYLFTFVNLEKIIIEGVQEWFKYDLTMGGYYLLFALIGSGLSLLKVVRIFLRPLFFWRIGRLFSRR